MVDKALDMSTIGGHFLWLRSPLAGRKSAALVRAIGLALLALPVMLFSVLHFNFNKRYLFDWFGIQPRTHVIVWAWEHDENLSYLDPARFEVAYFTEHVYLRGGNVMCSERTQKLVLPKGIVSFPVFRIDSLRSPSLRNKESLDLGPPPATAANRVVGAICDRLQELPATNKVQLDFDALQDERPFYREVLKELRRRLPSNMKISITALGSWLLGDQWLRDGDTDEVVAMLFSIGADRGDVLQRLRTQALSSGTKAKLSIGLSANERETNKALLDSRALNQSDTLYLFSSNGWTETRLKTALDEVLHQ
ncbi:MAG TPA: hypothetical protein V6C76_12015 [Drouetiella sp.]